MTYHIVFIPSVCDLTISICLTFPFHFDAHDMRRLCVGAQNWRHQGSFVFYTRVWCTLYANVRKKFNAIRCSSYNYPVNTQRCFDVHSIQKRWIDVQATCFVNRVLWDFWRVRLFGLTDWYLNLSNSLYS